MDDLMREFLTVTTESLNALDLDLVKLEKNPGDAELISRIFRLVHTVKGNCGFLSLPRLETVAHHAENVLGRYRSGALKVTPDSVSLILQSLDRIKSIVRGLAATGAEPPGDDRALIDMLDIVAAGKPQPQAVATEFQSAAATDDAAVQTLRISIDALEGIMETVGELVLTRNQLQQMQKNGERDIRLPLQRLHQTVSTLQEEVMKARLQPVSTVWGRLPRLLRDINIDLGKKIRLEMKGEETALDRQVLELIRDPLTHLVRNAAGHGVEKPAARVLAGKSPEGLITLSARHEGGQVVMEVSDDGHGLDASAIGRKAVEKGLLAPEKAVAISEAQMRQLIFMPEFSTAEQVTALSGRGVGMDVVRANIAKIGGTVDVSSIPGKGTSFTLRIPLTLAVVPALIVSVEGDRYAIPQAGVQEVLRMTQSGPHRIEKINETKMTRLRGGLLPLVSLHGMLGLDGMAVKSRNPCAIVIGQGSSQFGILVDRVLATEEIVVKPVSPALRHLRIFSGNAVLGDGGVVMIFDPSGIAQIAKINIAQVPEPEAPKALEAKKIPMLVFQAGGRCAVPLGQVARIERLPAAAIERAGKLKVVQHDGAIIPLVTLSNAPPGKSQPVVVIGDGVTQVGLMVGSIIDIVEASPDILLRQKSSPGLTGSAIVSGHVVDIIDAAYFLKNAVAGGA